MEQEYLELERAWTGPQSEMRQSDLRRRITREVRRHRADAPFFQDARTQQRLERCVLRQQPPRERIIHAFQPNAQKAAQTATKRLALDS